MTDRNRSTALIRALNVLVLVVSIPARRGADPAQQRPLHAPAGCGR